jgi:hypothetical protein
MHVSMIAWTVLCVLPTARVCPAQLPPLPEGNVGIAARYPDDAGIGVDADVVFAENFENVSGSSLTESNSAFDAVYGANSITQEPANVHGGTKAVERIHTSSSSFGAVEFIGNGYETVHLRYYMKYHPEFPGCHHTGGGIYAVAGSGYTQIGDITGVRPDGTNHYQAYLDDIPPFFSWSPEGNDTPPGWQNFYCYNMEQGSEYGDLLFPDGTVIPGASGIDLGSDFVTRPNFLAERGRWYCFEIMMQANTPGQNDGRLAFWVDGQLAGDFPRLLFRSVNTLTPNHVAISTYSSQVHENKTLWYDDVVAATSYIGPVVSGSGAIAPLPGTTEKHGPAGGGGLTVSPNPCHGSTRIGFAVTAAEAVTLSVFDTRGAMVRGLVSGLMDPGHHVVAWDGVDCHGDRVNAGCYVAALDGNSGSFRRQIMILK